MTLHEPLVLITENMAIAILLAPVIGGFIALVLTRGSSN